MPNAIGACWWVGLSSFRRVSFFPRFLGLPILSSSAYMELINFIWPLVTIVYPLHASIRAIENNSVADNRKCLMYWVACGFITLFEFTSAKLIQWLPFWSYIKLVATLLLVARHFEGAVYAYQHFVRPCFSMDPYAFGYWLKVKRDELNVSTSDNFVLLAKRFVQENGPEALEKVIDKVNSVEHKLAIEENKSAPSVDDKDGNPLKVSKLECSGNDTEHEATTRTENRAITEANVARASKRPESSIPNKIQKEWTCALCQVCAPNEVSLHNHIQGKKHKAKAEELKGSGSTQTNYKSGAASKTQPIGKVGITGGRRELPGLLDLDNTVRDWSLPLCQVYPEGKEHKTVSASNFRNTYKPKVTPKEGMYMHAQSNKEAVSNAENKPVVGVKGGLMPENTQKKWTCTLCQIFTPNEIALQDHFQGRKHRAKQMELSEKDSAANSRTASASALKYTVNPKGTPKGDASAAKNSEAKKVGDTGTGNKRIPVSEL